MALSASGLFYPTLAAQLTTPITNFDLGSETANYLALVDNTITPSFETNSQWADLSAGEVYGTGWTQGGIVLTTTTVAWDATGGGRLKYSADNVSETGTTLGAGGNDDVFGAVAYCQAATNDDLIVLVYFGGSSYSTNNGTFAITWDSAGIFYIDVTP